MKHDSTFFDVSNIGRHLPFYILCLCMLVFIWVLVRLTRSKKSKINLQDLLLGEDGTMSRSAFVLLGAFGVTTWGMVFMWLNDKMTEGYFTAYLGVWATPAVTKLIANAAVEAKKVPSSTINANVNIPK